MLAPVDKLEVQVLIDDVSDVLSPAPAFAESEFGYLLRTGRLPVITNKSLCCAVHGFCCLVTAHRGSQKHTILFDTGPEPYAFARNCERLGVDLGAVEAIVLSHGHCDHAGGVLEALDAIRKQNGHHTIPVYVQPGMFQSRAMILPNGTVLPFEDMPDVETLTAHGASVRQSTEPQSILDDMFYISGEIPRVTAFERGTQMHYRKSSDGTGWEPDPLVMDERYLAVDVAGKGQVVFTGCAHAGSANTLRSARDAAPKAPLYALIGGLHLAGMGEELTRQTVEAIREFDLKVVAPGHCTGWQAEHALTDALGEQVVAPCAVGKRYVF